MNNNVASLSTKTMTDNLPQDEDIRKQMEKLVRKIDIESITTKQFIKMLSKEMGSDLKEKKKFIKGALTDVLDAMENDSEEVEAEVEVEAEEVSGDEKDEPPTKEKPKRGGLTAVKDLSPELAAFLGMGNRLARTEVVKALWVYIKKHNLQNPEDKREILLDDKMKELFSVDKLTMFTLNKYVGAHIHPFKPVNLNELSENSKKKKENARKRKAAKINGTVKRRKPMNQPSWRLSDDLVAVVEKNILTRPQVTKALWAYIKSNDLQNPEDKREIMCNDILQKIMGGNEKVTMFSMNKHITKHLIEKVDKSEHEQEVDDEGTESEGSDEESD